MLTISAFCFRHGSIPFPAPSISHSPEGQPTEVHISRTFAWLPELGMLKRPRRAFFGYQTLAALPPINPKRQAGPHRSRGVSKRAEIIPLPRRERGRGARGQFEVPRALPRGARGGDHRATRRGSQRTRGSARARRRGRCPRARACAGARSGSGPAVAGGAGRGGAAAARGRRALPGFSRLQRDYE